MSCDKKRRRISACASFFIHSTLEVLTISSNNKKNDMLINEEIRDKEIRVIGADGAQLGIMPTKAALELAKKESLDLVNIAPKAEPPVCRIMNYGKYCFEQAKREKEAKKKQKVVEVKEVRLSLKIDVHDFNTKVNQAIKFLEHGDRVKVAIRYRGRELAHPELGNEVMERFKQACTAGVVDKAPKMEGRSLVMFMSAKPNK
ncbi:MAG: translation initiation factor IF-3 [Oscillospiraceae bacterium]|nr:translation initiation factor IF-3 [Oscillospiraceae bacterium]